MITDQHHIELDDMPIAQAVCASTCEVQPAEPDIGIFGPSVECGCEITAWSIGDLHLTRDQLCLAIGRDALLRLEEREAVIVAEKTEPGDLE